MHLMMDHSGFWLFAVFWFLLAVAGFVFWIWGLIHAIRNPALDDTMRIIWILLIVFLQLLGVILYYFLAPKARPPAT